MYVSEYVSWSSFYIKIRVTSKDNPHKHVLFKNKLHTVNCLDVRSFLNASESLKFDQHWPEHHIEFNLSSESLFLSSDVLLEESALESWPPIGFQTQQQTNKSLTTDAMEALPSGTRAAQINLSKASSFTLLSFISSELVPFGQKRWRTFGGPNVHLGVGRPTIFRHI